MKDRTRGISAAQEKRFVKTTINIRPVMMKGVFERMDDLGKEEFIDYLRDLISLDLKYKLLGTCDPMSLTQFKGEIGFEKKETQEQALERILSQGSILRSSSHKSPRPYNGPPPKYEGFLSYLKSRFWRKRHSEKQNISWRVQERDLVRSGK